MSIFSDKIKKSLGFPTKKETMDKSISKFRQKEENHLNNSIAIRNQGISFLNEQIRQIEQIINDNQFVIDNYLTIKNKAIEKIKLGDNPVKLELYDLDGSIIIKGNYKIMLDYYQTLLKKGTDVKVLDFFNKQITSNQNNMWILYADKIIEGKGVFCQNNIEIDDCYDIFIAYTQTIKSMHNGNIKDENRQSVILSDTKMSLIIKLYNITSEINNRLALIIQDFKIKLNSLESQNCSEEYILKTIEEARNIMKSSKEYFNAKLSHEYLEELNKLKK